MVTEDCNCKPPAGFVKAKRVAGGSAAGAWGSAFVGDVLMVPREVVERRPGDWLVLTGAPEQPAVASGGIEGMTVPELTALAAERGVSLPAKARKAEILQALEDAGN